ncbi:MAG TPA: glycosyltransferase, partial [Gemmatimonadales bacterium]|nr:glycosyltransferase [Gemmatimonadales bacterium]
GARPDPGPPHSSGARFPAAAREVSTLFCLLAAVAGGSLLLGWVGYPWVLRLLTTGRRRLVPPAEPVPGGVSVVIATREPPEQVRDRVRNVRESVLPGSPLEIVVAVDQSVLERLVEYRTCCEGLARVVPGDAPGGKACNLNAAVRESAHSLLVFTDSAQAFRPDAIARLVACFDDGTVGAATGTLDFGSAAPTSPLLHRFWSYELHLRERESLLDSVVAVTGAIYAMRRSLWMPLPAGLICDDLFVPMQVVRQGRRVVASTESIAVDERRFTRVQEFRRKVRTLTGMIQFCVLCPWALLPWRNRIWGQFVCHKLLRLSTPYLLVLTGLGLALCVPVPRWLWGTLAAVALTLALLVLLAPAASRPRRLGRQLVWAGYLLIAPLAATLNALRGNWDVWTPHRHPPAG